MSTLRLAIRTELGERIERFIGILARQLKVRAGVDVVHPGVADTPGDGAANHDADLVLAVESGIGAEGFRIADEPGGGVRITGNDDAGLLYGIGRYLHDAVYAPGLFTPGPWRGESVPQGTLRGMYFAFHDNWYNKAPLQEVQDYIEELALWGLNTILFHLPLYEEASSAEAAAASSRNAAIVRHARALGIRTGLIAEPNILYGPVPVELHAPGFPDTDPVKRGTVGNRVCVSKPAGFQLMKEHLENYLGLCREIGLDYAVAFPYDSGGCGCADCWPWGARGYVAISREYSRIAKELYPGCKFVLGTWCFDVREESDGEYEGLEKVLAEDSGWVDMIMADAHEEFPPYPLQPGALAGLPIINFAEISMWGRFPWGGSGANPFPARLQRLWDGAKDRLSGGFPYSEGNFEDINKVICLRFYWDAGVRAEETVREYIRYEFGPAVVAEVFEAVMLMEKTLHTGERTAENSIRIHELMLAADARLQEGVRASWRWQILFWRAVVDFERATHDNAVTDRCDEAFEKLIQAMHLQDGWRAVTPPSRAYMERFNAREAAAKPDLESVLPGASS